MCISYDGLFSVVQNKIMFKCIVCDAHKLNHWLFWDEQIINDLSTYSKFSYSAICIIFVCGATK